MASKKPLILVTNDDGVNSKGIAFLTQIASRYGDVVVIAPDSPQSGMGHAITIGETLRINDIPLFDNLNIRTYECSGTPADCVKVAKSLILKETPPDLVLSGVNHGSNASISVLYSGTMSAAIEAAIEGIPAIGFSLADYDHHADMSHVEEHAHKIVSSVLEKGLPEKIALNVNFPSKTEEPIKGIKFAKQAVAKWQEKFDERKDPYNRPYYWLAGDFVNYDKADDADINLVNENYTTVVPCKFDMTDYDALNHLSENWNL